MLNVAVRLLISIILLFLAAPTLGQDSPPVVALTFQAWKDQQVLEAQNQILRASAQLKQVKSGHSSTAADRDTMNSLSSSKIKKAAGGDLISAAERDLKRAQDSLTTAGDLQFTDYIIIYLISLQDQPETISKLAERMTKEELIEVTKTLIQKGARQPNARRNSKLTSLNTLPRRSDNPSF